MALKIQINLSNVTQQEFKLSKGIASGHLNYEL